MQSQTFFGADSGVHALLMRHFSPNDVECHVAYNRDGDTRAPTHPLLHLQDIPNLHLHPARFGPTVCAQSRAKILATALTQAPALPAHLLAIARHARRQKIDVVHCTEKPRDAFYGALIARLAGARHVVHLHVKFDTWLKPSVQWAMRQSDAIIGVSQFVAETIVAAGFDPKKVYGIGNSLDLSTNQWNPNPQDALAVRREWGISEDAPLLGISARICLWKGHADLIEALGIVRKSVPNVRLLIVGEDDPRAHPGGGSFTAELKEQIRRLGLEENVIFTGWRVDMPRFVNAFDIYAMPSFEEPWGIAYLEAMALEKPIVAYHSGGAIEIVEHGKTGLLTPVRDIPAYADALLQTLDREKARRMGKAGRVRLETVLTPQRMCSEVLQVYRDILQR